MDQHLAAHYAHYHVLIGYPSHFTRVTAMHQLHPVLALLEMRIAHVMGKGMAVACILSSNNYPINELLLLGNN